ncbi:hypothetical protein [Actinomadura sp. GTD37]|uniref:hypothetical protein n=1 Tax=Actinomadura sp. GTD37 TaxID=1778030 RepID=UPI0035BF6146
MLIDEPVSAETTSTGRPSHLTGPRGRYPVRRVLEEWQAPGQARFYRLQVATPDGLAIAEVLGPEAPGAAPWTLHRVWA